IPITTKAIKSSDDPVTQQKLSLDHIREEFAPIFTARHLNPRPLQKFLDEVPLPDFSQLDFDITVNDITESIKSANSKSAPGPDGITYAFLKKNVGKLAQPIHNIYLSMKAGKTHRKLLDSRLTMLKKPGFYGDPKDLHPIAITNTILRVIQRAISYKIIEQVTEKITPHQKGFMKNRYIGECIKNVSNHITTLTKGWSLFVDFEKVYDSVDWKALKQILTAMKFPPEFITLIAAMLKPSKALLMDSDMHICISRGIPQG